MVPPLGGRFLHHCRKCIASATDGKCRPCWRRGQRKWIALSSQFRGPKTWNQVKSHRRIVTAYVVDVMSTQQIRSLCSDWDDQLGVRGVDGRGRPSASSVTSRKWCGRRDVCRWSRFSWLAASHNAEVFRTLYTNSRLPQSMKQTDAEIFVQPVRAWQNGHQPPWPASNVTKLKTMTYCRSSSPATRRGHTTSPVMTMESMVWRHSISPAKKKLDPYDPALNSICCWSYVHFKCSSLHLSGKAFSHSSIKLYVYRMVTDPFGQCKFKRPREQESLSLMSRGVVW